ncbi:MAG: helix-turn-helix domain-containing protein [Vicinamibacterales bacterium]
MKPSTTTPQSSTQTGQRTSGGAEHPLLLTVEEAAVLLRTTRRAMYAMVERRQLPGVVRIRRRVLFRTAALLDWVDRKSAPLPKE